MRPVTDQHPTRVKLSTQPLTPSRLMYTQKPTAQTAMTKIDITLFQPKIHPTAMTATPPARMISHLPPTVLCRSVHAGSMTSRAWSQIVRPLSESPWSELAKCVAVGEALFSEVTSSASLPSPGT